MSPEQLDLILDLLQLSLPEKVKEKILTNQPISTEYQNKVDAVLHLNLRIRNLYVQHTPRTFRVNVSHDDFDRFPGSLNLAINDEVRLVTLMSERYIPVRITEIPESSGVYYKGVIIKKLDAQSLFEVGDGVRFTEDQVSL